MTPNGWRLVDSLICVVVVLALLAAPASATIQWSATDPPGPTQERAPVLLGSSVGSTSDGDADRSIQAREDRAGAMGVERYQTGASPTPEIVVRPETLQFPGDPYGTATRSLEIANVGNGTLHVREIAVVGPDSAHFFHDASGPMTLDPGENRSVSVSFEASEDAPRFATMHVLSDDPDAPQVNVWLTNTEMVASVSPSRLVGDLTMVNSTIDDAVANTSQSINISWPLTRDDAVAVDALAFTPERSGAFTVNVTKSLERFGDSPEFDRSDGTESAAVVQIDHSIPNTAVHNVTVTFRVRKDRLTGNETGPEDVRLYRYRNGSWRELPTRMVNEGPTHYFFEASSPGLSDFTVGVKRAKFRITDAVVSVTTIEIGEETEVLVRVTNVGGADGTYSVRLLSGSTVVDSRDLSIAPNGTRQATFVQSYADAGTYELYVNDRFVANVTVNGSEETGGTTAGTQDGQPETGTSSTGPGFTVAATVLALALVSAVHALRRRRLS